METVGTWLAILALALGLPLVGLLLFPLRVRIQWMWGGPDNQISLHFWRWQYQWPAVQVPATEPTPTPAASTPIRPQNTDPVPSTPAPEISTPPVAPPRPSPDSTAETIRYATTRPTEPLPDPTPVPAARWQKTICQKEVWKASAIWLKNTIRPSIKLVNLHVDQVDLIFGQKDPTDTALAVSIWSSIAPLSPHLQPLTLHPDWRPRWRVELSGSIRLEHRLWRWIPWATYLAWKFPWQTTWRAWRRAGRAELEPSLGKWERKCLEWIKQD